MQNEPVSFNQKTAHNGSLLSSYDRTRATDTSIQDSKLKLEGGSKETYPYEIDKEDVNNWIMFIATWDGSQQKIQLRNYYDVVNVPGKGSSSYSPATPYSPVRNNLSKLYIGHGYGDGYNKLNLFKGNIDDIRIYSRVISQDEIETIFSLSDSEPPVPGGEGDFNVTNDCKISWQGAEDDVTSNLNIRYRVVGTTGKNRINTVESALLNDSLNYGWIDNSSMPIVTNISNGYVNVLVKDEGGNMDIYNTKKCN
jgi:hypothetical protein